jgi:HTH-type transcriptional regulator/antitoxin HigA
MLTEDEYNRAMKRIDEIFMAEAGTAEGEELDRLASSVEEYENKHFPMLPQVVIAIRDRMKELGVRQRDLVKAGMRRGHVSEIVNGKRGVSKASAKIFSKTLGIPLEKLI